MAFLAQTHRVFIASPSDLEEERLAATQAVNDWNAMHSVAEGVVLLPVRWETHAYPQTGVRPQAALNDQLVSGADVIIGLFWTKLGTSTGVAASGTIEEIEHGLVSGKPVMLYFSDRPISPGRIDLDQQAKLRDFRKETYETALVGRFASVEELGRTLLRDLTAQLRAMGVSKRPRRSKLDETERLVTMMESFKRSNITPEDVHRFRDELLRPRQPRTKSKPSASASGETGPNGGRLETLKNGDIVEWIPDDEGGEDWPMVVKRGDKAIRAAEEEFSTVVWYDRKLVLIERLKEGSESIDPQIEEGMRAAMIAAEKKYGKRKLNAGHYYHDDFTWGMLNGKLSALRWVMGDDWDMLDT